jgi:chromosome segregation ATPase
MEPERLSPEAQLQHEANEAIRIARLREHIAMEQTRSASEEFKTRLARLACHIRDAEQSADIAEEKCKSLYSLIAQYEPYIQRLRHALERINNPIRRAVGG